MESICDQSRKPDLMDILTTKAESPNILFKIAYDGSGFHGWQKQPGLRTVQGVLEERLEKVYGVPVSLEGTSRTDAGVHAFGQCATMRGVSGIPTDRIKTAVNNLVSDVMILSAEEKDEGFHARFSAVGKTYIYRFVVAPSAPVFLRNYTWLLKYEPNISIMSEIAKYLEGTHDFACFQAAGGVHRESTTRTIFRAEVKEAKGKDPAGNTYDAIEFVVTGDGFLYNMVRIIAGTLLEAGFSRPAPKDIQSIIQSKDRRRAGPTAPPQGLFLQEVFFEKTAMEAL